MPNTREKLISRPWQPQDLIDDLQSIIDEESDNYLNTRRTTLCMARDYLKEYFAEPKWISVKDRLPEDWKERVLVKIKDANNIIGHPDMDTDRYMGDIWVRWGHNVTHWMPLPQPPKGE